MGFLPLRMGVIVCESIRDLFVQDEPNLAILSSQAKKETMIDNEVEPIIDEGEDLKKLNIHDSEKINSIKLKWPNDVLIHDRKVAGLLIEMEKDYFLIGVGINVASSPMVPTAGGERGRPATSLASHGLSIYPNSMVNSNTSEGDQTTSNEDISKELRNDIDGELIALSSAQELAFLLLNRIREWLDDGLSSSPEFPLKCDNPNRIRQDWRRLAQLNFAYELRDEGSIVYPIDIQEDGSLLVRDANGKTRVLIADYLF